MTADVTRRTWSLPSPAVIRASQRAQREAKSLEAARALLDEAEAAIASCTDTPAAHLRARIALFRATT